MIFNFPVLCWPLNGKDVYILKFLNPYALKSTELKSAQKIAFKLTTIELIHLTYPEPQWGYTIVGLS